MSPALQWVAFAGALLLGLPLLGLSFFAIGNLVAAPLLDLLAERALRGIRDGAAPPTGGGSALHAFGRQLAILGLAGAAHLVLLPLLIIPVANLLYPLLAGTLAALFLAYNFLDYAFSADRRPLKERLAFIRRHRRPCLGFGAALLLLLLVPPAAYLALPACTAAAVLLYEDLRAAA